MKIAAYYADWAENLTPARIPYARLTHLIHAFAPVTPDGSLRCPSASRSRELVRRCRAARVVPVIAVGGASSGDAFRAARLRRLVGEIAALVEAEGYGGVDVDWEFAESADDAKKLLELTEAIRQRLPKTELSLAAPATDWYGRWLDAAALARLIDAFHLMAYDFSGPWSDKAGHNAALPDVAGSLTYWIEARKIAPEKLALGVPFYGRGFQASAFGQPAKGTYERSELAYASLGSLTKAGWATRRDEAAKVPFLTAPDGREVVSYDDATSIAEKCRLAVEKRLGGIFAWELSQDGPGFPLLTAMARRSAPPSRHQG